MAYRRSVCIAVLCLGAMFSAVPASAERIPLEGWGPFELRPGDVLSGTFDLRWFPEPQALATFDSLQFMPGISAVQPIGSYSTRLSDRGRLLGTYHGTGANAAQMGFGSWFAAPGSFYARGAPTVVDFSTFRDATFDGAVEFQIHDGLARLHRASDELDLGFALTPEVAWGWGFAPRTYELIVPDPVPEPTSLLLFGTGAAGLALRRRGRRRMRRATLAAVAAVLICTLTPETASAETVTFRFNIQIDTRCTTDACERFDAFFPLTMTVDSLVSATDNAWNHERRYGVPSLSAIPLERPEIAADASPMYTPAFDTTFLYEGGWRRVAHAYSGFQWTTAVGTFNWNTSIYRTDDKVWPLPDLTRRTMAEFLAATAGPASLATTSPGSSPGAGCQQTPSPTWAPRPSRTPPRPCQSRRACC